MTAASGHRLRGDLVDLVHRTTDARDFSLRAARIVGRAVPFDGVCVLTLDPATLLPTGEIAENALPETSRTRMAQIEIGADDVNTFRGLLRSGRGAASLLEATDGDLNRSVRHREVRGPNGFGDELRSVLTSGTTAWGAVTLLRGADHRPFTVEDKAVLTMLSPHLAEGLRRATLLTALAGGTDEQEPGAAGMLVLADDGSPMLVDASAEHWLARLSATESVGGLPRVVAAVASRARRATADGEPLLARARACARRAGRGSSYAGLS